MKSSVEFTTAQAPGKHAPFESRRFRLFGVDSDKLIKIFFGGNATIAIVVLLLITIFLLREGYGFFGQNRDRLELYRKSGLEYVDYMRAQVDDFYALSRFLTHIKTRRLDELQRSQGLSWQEASRALQPFDEFTQEFGLAVAPLQSLVDRLKINATSLRDDIESSRSALLSRKKRQKAAEAARNAGDLELAIEEEAAAAAIPVKEVRLEDRRLALFQAADDYYRLSDELQLKVRALANQAPAIVLPERAPLTRRFNDLIEKFISDSENAERKVGAWDPREPVPFYTAITTFIFGTEWVTNSFFQDWYGVVPLLMGSLIVSAIALALAVPFGVAAAIYVSQFANKHEQKWMKPFIEFIAAIPSVVIGFFGVLVWGEFVRMVSGLEFLSWLPFFPIAERLNAFTAGCLLALMAIPTVFTLAEDALNSVPRAFKEASYAVGANRLQTTFRIIVPTAISGIISAVLLGFGRVIGETMVVLLCAGNRIAIPDFSNGLGGIFEPVHTMTGVIAQEMGEVVSGSIHYRALFLVGALLFFISLLINYLAQKILRRFRLAAL